MVARGHVQDGVAVLDNGAYFPEGQGATVLPPDRAPAAPTMKGSAPHSSLDVPPYVLVRCCAPRPPPPFSADKTGQRTFWKYNLSFPPFVRFPFSVPPSGFSTGACPPGTCVSPRQSARGMARRASTISMKKILKPCFPPRRSVNCCC